MTKLFSQIKGDSEMNSDHSTTGTTSTGKQIDYKGESETNGSASMIKSKFVSGATADHENMQSGWEKTYYDRYCMKAYTYYSKGYRYYYRGKCSRLSNILSI